MRPPYRLDWVSLGLNIHRTRERLGLSTEQLGERTRIADRTIRSLEAGKHEPLFGSVLLVANALDVTLDQLLQPADGRRRGRGRPRAPRRSIDSNPRHAKP
jgi:transcriptional regulator with XRE-family HTH domain